MDKNILLFLSIDFFSSYIHLVPYAVIQENWTKQRFLTFSSGLSNIM